MRRKGNRKGSRCTSSYRQDSKKEGVIINNEQQNNNHIRINLHDEEVRLKLNESLVWNLLHYEPTSGKNYIISQDEVEGSIEAIIDSIDDSYLKKINNNCENEVVGGIDLDLDSLKNVLIESIMDYFPDFIIHNHCAMIVDQSIKYVNGEINYFGTDRILNETSETSDGDDDDSGGGGGNQVEEDDDSFESSNSDDEENYIQDGECELCEREVKLSKHHMIPRSTWPRIRPRFMQAAPYFIDGDMKMVKQILNFEHIPATLLKEDFSSPSKIKYFLSCYTCDICRLCHSAVHRAFDNMELAETRNSVDSLLEDDKIQKFCKWANKQKPRRK